MTNVLVVNHDIDLADQQTDSLRRHGYTVRQCFGPTGGHCPVLAGLPCALAEEADVLLYDAFATGEPEGARRLIEGLRDMHPEIPIVLVASGMEPDWMETFGPHEVTPLVGLASGDRLAVAIEASMESARQHAATFLPV